MATGKSSNQIFLENLDYQELYCQEIKQILQLICSDSFRRIDGKQNRIHKVRWILLFSFNVMLYLRARF